MLELRRALLQDVDPLFGRAVVASLFADAIHVAIGGPVIAALFTPVCVPVDGPVIATLFVDARHMSIGSPVIAPRFAHARDVSGCAGHANGSSSN